MATYTRQSSAGIVDGGTIEASDLNDEFDQLASAFLAPTFGSGTAGTDIVMTFDGESADGVITWMEDEDLFKFSDAINVGVDGTGYDVKLFGDTAGSYWLWDQSADGVVQIGTLTIGVDDAGHDVKFFGNTASAYMLWDTSTDDLVLAGAAQLYLYDAGGGERLSSDGTDLTINSGNDINLTATTDVNIPSGVGVTFGDDGEKIEGDGTNLTISTSNNVTVDAAADIILDAGGADVTLKDDGTTFGSLTNSGGELVVKSGSTPTTAATFSGANVTFAGTVGSGAVTSTGIVTGTGFTAGSAVLAESELELLDGLTAGTAIASKVVTTDSSIDTTGQRNLTISGELDAATLDISGDADIDGTLEADAITVDGTTLAEYISDTAGGMFSSNTETGISATYQDGDNTIDLEVAAAQTTITSLLATDIKIGEDDQTKIDFETANEIHLYADNAEQVYVADGIFGPQSDSDVDLGTTGVRWKDAFIDSVTTTGNVTVGGDLTVTGDDITMGTNTSGAALIGDGTNFNPVVIDTDATIATDGALTIANNAVSLAKMAGLARGKIIYGDASGDPAALAIGSNTYVLKSDGTDISWGAQSVSSLAADDLSAGDAAVTLSTTSGNITVDATANNSDIIFKGTDATADITMLTLDGSEAGKAIFNAGLTIADAGTIGSASDADSIAIASDGVVTMNQIPVFSAGINVSGGSIAGTLATAAQTNITSLGTLTALTIDNMVHNGDSIVMTPSTDDTVTMTAATNGAFSLVTVDTAAAAANIQITADGTAELAGTTVTLDSGADIVLDAAGNNVTFKSAGTAILDFSNSSSDAVITSSVQDKDIIFKGDDGGGAVTALTMDMSAAGKSIFGAAAVGATLTDTSNSGSITLDFDTYQNFVLTATGNVTLANPSTESAGQSGVIVLIQDGTGSRTLSTGSEFEWPAGTAGTISTAANAVDIIPYFVDASSSILLGAPQLAMATPS